MIDRILQVLFVAMALLATACFALISPVNFNSGFVYGGF